MRVLYFTRDYTTHDFRFLTTMKAKDNRIFFLRLENLGRKLESRDFPEDVQEINWDINKKPFQYRKVFYYLFYLKKIIDRYKPDLIHAGPVHNVAFLSALTKFSPLVTMSWGSDILVEADKSYYLRKITTFTLKKSKVLIVDCETVALKAIQFGFPRDRIVKFPWGVDLNHFSPNKATKIRKQLKWDKKFIILSVRSWEPIYGIDILIKAFSRIAKDYPFVRLLLLGGGSLSREIHQILESNDIVDFVYFGGQVNQNELHQYYNAADLYVSTSYSDGSSVSLMESLASGCPVLVSDISGNREWITEGKEGLLFCPGDEEDLVRQMEYVLQNRSSLSSMANAARKLAEQRANWSKNSKKLFHAYELAIKASKDT